MSKYSPVWDHIRGQAESPVILTFAEIERLSGVPVDHSFLTEKKELRQYGWRVGKISLRAKTVIFRRDEQESGS